MSSEREYHQAHNKGMSIHQRRDWVRKQAAKEDAKGLPFELSKPPRRRGRSWDEPCEECGTGMTITMFTFIAVCPQCSHFNKFEKGERIDDSE
jgi:hypothetical protein